MNGREASGAGGRQAQSTAVPGFDEEFILEQLRQHALALLRGQIPQAAKLVARKPHARHFRNSPRIAQSNDADGIVRGSRDRSRAEMVAVMDTPSMRINPRPVAAPEVLGRNVDVPVEHLLAFWSVLAMGVTATVAQSQVTL
jgi:hypothetical protein